jgi:Cu/Zn superoxide dismutase
MTDKVKVDQIRGRAVMVHRYGTNEAGKPKGGGARFACGVIPK